MLATEFLDPSPCKYNRFCAFLSSNLLILRDIPGFCPSRGVRSGGLWGGLSPGFSGRLSGGLSPGLSPGLAGGLYRGLSPGLCRGLSPGFSREFSSGFSRVLRGGLPKGSPPGSPPHSPVGSLPPTPLWELGLNFGFGACFGFRTQGLGIRLDWLRLALCSPPRSPVGSPTKV